MVRQNRTIIQRMDKEATVDIETEKLKYLCDIAESITAHLKHQALVVETVVLQLSIKM